MIPQRNISILSNRLARKGGRRIPETVLERDYCLSWFLVGLSKSPLKDVLLFKGGTAIKKCYIGGYRFSEDLDFTLARELSFEDIIKDIGIAFDQTRESSGIRLDHRRPDRQSHMNSHTFYIGYEGPLPRTSGSQVKVDITIREKIVFPIKERPVIKEYAEYADIPDNSRVRVYSLDEIAAEKAVALFDRARNEPRDLYDIWYLASYGYVKIKNLIEAVEQKLEFRNKKFKDIKDEFLQKEARLRKLWDVRLSSQMSALPEFDGVHRVVKREFRQAGLLY